MAKITKNPHVKARETKLNKKSKEELVAIVLKKDNIERNLNKQIKSLKEKVNVYANVNNGLRKDMDGTLKTLARYKEDIITLTDKYNRDISYWNNKYNKAKATTKYVATIYIVVGLIIGFAIGVLC